MSFSLVIGLVNDVLALLSYVIDKAETRRRPIIILRSQHYLSDVNVVPRTVIMTELQYETGEHYYFILITITDRKSVV